MSFLAGISCDACMNKNGLIQHWRKSETAVCLTCVAETGLSIQDVVVVTLYYLS
ncbi:hypothetical protein D3C80_2221160 [compost metagenome]